MMDFTKEKTNWEKVLEKIFGEVIPIFHEWNERYEITEILNKIGSIKDSNLFYLPGGGEITITSARDHWERNCIEVEGVTIHILKPTRLIFHSFKSSTEWFYFRLETEDLEATGIYNNNSKMESLIELKEGQYIDISHWHSGEYHGMDFTNRTRLVNRYLSGSFAIFQKPISIIDNAAKYQKEYFKSTDEEFRNKIENEILNND